MGEKIVDKFEYYMELSESTSFATRTSTACGLGSNYLKLDMHVDSLLPSAAKDALDPWAFSGGAAEPGPGPIDQ